jgi:hypothetical protein
MILPRASLVCILSRSNQIKNAVCDPDRSAHGADAHGSSTGADAPVELRDSKLCWSFEIIKRSVEISKGCSGAVGRPYQLMEHSVLKCALDTDGKHIREWASVLEQVDKCVKVQAKAEGKKLRDFHGRSLQTLAKNPPLSGDGNKITYLPSEGGDNHDSRLLRLRRHGKLYGRVLSGKLSVLDAIREAGMKRGTDVSDPVDRVSRPSRG